MDVLKDYVLAESRPTPRAANSVAAAIWACSPLRRGRSMGLKVRGGGRPRVWRAASGRERGDWSVGCLGGDVGVGGGEEENPT
ncbi:hypothetical protein NDU88_002568 [Pleurodeles waltl]|uniref:Uncharacterized protein n=1 Tax=Pleurodeles waltl TaxID=8319 RepID=A0AAV7W376_PLEWA|nr:hypothetical protein NDU88_002568 [Pleurodeles waltl]